MGLLMMSLQVPAKANSDQQPGCERTIDAASKIRHLKNRAEEEWATAGPAEA
jgi:hypothetical protein